MKQEQIILLRGVMPSGKNSIPKMAILRQQLEEAGFEAVRTYIQSGNILLRSELSAEALSIRIHDLLAEHYGADIAALVFRPEEIQGWIDACPFPSDLDPSRVFFTMTMERPDVQRLQVLAEKSWGEAELHLSAAGLNYSALLTYGLPLAAFLLALVATQALAEPLQLLIACAALAAAIVAARPLCRVIIRRHLRLQRRHARADVVKIAP